MESRGRHARRLFRGERLESRHLPTATLYVDLLEEFKDVDGQGTVIHDYLTVDTNGDPNIGNDDLHWFDGVADSGVRLDAFAEQDGTLRLSRMRYDWNRDGQSGTESDLDLLWDKIYPHITRAFEPFAINVVRASSSDFADARSTVDANDGLSIATAKRADAYVLVGEFIDPFLTPALQGAAAGYNLSQYRNERDQTAWLFTEDIRSRLAGEGYTEYTQAFDDMLVRRIAGVLVHEAGHSFGLHHLGGNNSNECLISRGLALRDSTVCSGGFYPLEVSHAFNRFDSWQQDDTQLENHYELLGFGSGGSDYQIGLRDENANNIPDLAYVTGTGAHDKIEIKLKVEGQDVIDDIAVVTVSAYNTEPDSNGNFSSGLIRTESYEIKLSNYTPQSERETEGEILIETGMGSDVVKVDHNIAASIRVYANEGDDYIKIVNTGTLAITGTTLWGENGDDKIFGSNVRDIIYGHAGSDSLWGYAGNDLLYGDDSSITSPGYGGDTIWGGEGNDGINGGDGNDSLYGNEGNDTIYGSASQDHIEGGTGADRLHCTVPVSGYQSDGWADSVYTNDSFGTDDNAVDEVWATTSDSDLVVVDDVYQDVVHWV